jgi:hypothetical protein
MRKQVLLGAIAALAASPESAHVTLERGGFHGGEAFRRARDRAGLRRAADAARHTGDKTYSNYQEANRVFWRQTVLPLAGRIGAALAQ